MDKLRDIVLGFCLAYVLIELIEAIADIAEQKKEKERGGEGETLTDEERAWDDADLDGLQEIEAYRQYVEGQIFEGYEDFGGRDLDDWQENLEGTHFDSESVGLDDPRISDDQREAILEEIRRQGLPVEGAMFDMTSERAQEDFYKFNPAVGDRLVFAVTPWGEVISSRFSSEHMEMAVEISRIEKKPIDDVIMEIMAERYNIANGLE